MLTHKERAAREVSGPLHKEDPRSNCDQVDCIADQGFSTPENDFWSLVLALHFEIRATTILLAVPR